ncbi:MAG: ECF transporter S component [Lachnospiraceae bacterium]|nr:ECF transporter S component [Lachnospiraceae bacterium]
MKKITTKQIVTAGILLGLMVVSQIFKNISVFITGPIVNTILIIATLTLGLWVGIILSIIAPVTSFLITGAPIMKMVPLIIPAIMIGNIILCVATYTIYKRVKINHALSLPIGMVTGCVLKAAFMGGVISNCLLVYTKAVQNLKPEALAAAKVTFSGTQLITALIGSAIAYVIWLSAGKYLKSLSE